MNSRVIPNIDFFTLLEQELDEKGSVVFIVKGFSMQPILRNNRDQVLLTKVDGGLQEGDICLFKVHGKHILHRLIRREGDSLYMRGDNVIDHCDICTPEDVVGVVKTVYRDGKSVSPTSRKWHIITILHRLYMRVRHFFGKIYHKIFK